MADQRDRSLEQVEMWVAAALRQAGGDAQASVAGVAEVIARELKPEPAGTALLTAVSALASAAARAAVSARATGRVAEGFLIGVMLAGHQREFLFLALVSHAAETFVKHVREAGGDAAEAARGLVEGAVAWAGEAGVDAGEAASAAAQGAVDAAEDIDEATGRAVRGALTAGPIAGLSVALKERAAPSSS